MNAPTFDGFRVAAFESRRADEMANMIRRFQGQPFVSPSMREVPLTSNHDALNAAKGIMTGEIDIAIFLTGVGFTYFVEAIHKRVDHERFIAALGDIITVARGPKPVASMKSAGLSPTLEAPEPNTWRELLSTIDQHLVISNQNILLQEYGKPNPSLIAGLEARGGRVLPLVLYRWDLPEDTSRLRENVQAIVKGEREVAIFTSAQQVVHVLQIAAQLGCEGEFREGLRRTVVCSIGPTTTEALRGHRLHMDIAPVHPKLGHLVRTAAAVCAELSSRKERIRATLSSPASDPIDDAAPWYDSPFMRACRLEANEVTPIWLMRQAGRYMPEYRAIREKISFLELCKRPDLCAEIMVNTVNSLGVDAAIIFSDLLPILEPMGFELEYAPGDGPVIHNPVREATSVDRVLALDDVQALDFVIDTVRQTRTNLPADIPLIGFAGAPFTLASYAIEGGGSRSFIHTKTLMYRDRKAWDELLSRFVRSVTVYATAQIAAGAQCIQLFDSWAGCLGPADYRRFVLPHMRSVISALPTGVPVISFATGNPALLPCLAAAQPTVVGVDWRIPLGDAWEQIGYRRAIQGNLDPAVLLAAPDTMCAAAKEVLTQAAGRPGHIFNLGHGVLPPTPVENARRLVDYVHQHQC